MSPWGLNETSEACKYPNVRERFRWAGGVPENIENIVVYVQATTRAILELNEPDFVNDELFNIRLPVHKKYNLIFLIYSADHGKKGYWDFASFCLAQKAFDRHGSLLTKLVKSKISEFNSKNEIFNRERSSSDFKRFRSWLSKLELGSMILRRFYASQFIKMIQGGGELTLHAINSSTEETTLDIPKGLRQYEYSTPNELKVGKDALWIPIDMSFTMADCFICLGRKLYAFRSCLGPYYSNLSSPEEGWGEKEEKRWTLT